MSSRIPQQFIDELIARADIVEAIQAHVPLKKAGKEFKACCPFHDEKTPSFTVSPDKQFYHCFGCGAHGTVIGFLMDFKHLSFVEAIEELANGLGLDVPRDRSDAGPRPEPSLYDTLERASRFYRRQLKDNTTAIEYLKRRGLSGDIAAQFALGYAPDTWDALAKHLGRSADDQKRLLTAGLVSRRADGGLYDRFRGRIVFPIRDTRGRTIAFGGRVLGTEEPKYLNSPEMPLFHKGRELYGLFEARQALRDIDKLLVVEGYMDVVGLANEGIRYAVATLGTATTTEQVTRLFRICNEIVFCFDGDRAGRAAAWRALQNGLPEVREGREMRFLFLPEGEDPDSLVAKEGKQRFEARLPEAVPLSDFLLETLEQGTDLGSLEGRAKMAEQARPLLNRIPLGVFRRLLIERLAVKVRMQPETLESLLEDREAPRPSRSQHRPPIAPGRGNLVRQAISLLLQRPQLAGCIEDTTLFSGSELPGLALLVELTEGLKTEPELTTAQILERWRDRPEGQHLRKLVRLHMQQTARRLALADETALEKEFHGLIERLESSLKPARETELLDKLSQSGLSDEELTELKALHAARHVAESR